VIERTVISEKEALVMKRSFKQLVGISLAGLLLSLLALPSQAITVQDIVNPRQQNNTWVTDSAEILKPATETQLNQLIDRLEQKNGSEIAVVTVPATKPAKSPKAFATELFNYWHIGKKDQNNGVLILISKADRRVEIETGYGVEPILSDAQVVNIIDTKMLPRFKQSDFDGGVIAGTNSIVATLETTLSQDLAAVNSATESTQVVNVKQEKPSNNVWGFLGKACFFLLFPVFLFTVIFGNKLGTKTSTGGKSSHSNGSYYGHGDSSNSGSSSGGYSDGGGGGFGGGDSGGGGGGGSW
jgi:uncharacterized protein